MIITNHMDLPQAFVEMCKSDYITPPKVYRVTSLLKGLRETILERRHADEISVDAADMIWLLFGTAVHNILEKQPETETELKEDRIACKFGEYTLTGKFDLYCDKSKKVTDYKTASIWKVIYQDFDDWRKQLLIYAYLLREAGFDCNKGEVVAILKDHSKTKAAREQGYPQHPVHRKVFKFSEKDFAEIEVWLNEQFIAISELEQLPNDELPVCTPDQRFNSGDKFAVMKKGRKSALRVLGSKEEADLWMEQTGKGEYVETRPGTDIKCNDYCRVSAFCDYHMSRTEREVEEVFA